MNSKITNEDIKVLGRIVSISTEDVVADAEQVFDSQFQYDNVNKGMRQSAINNYFKAKFQGLEGLIFTLSNDNLFTQKRATFGQPISIYAGKPVASASRPEDGYTFKVDGATLLDGALTVYGNTTFTYPVDFDMYLKARYGSFTSLSATDLSSDRGRFSEKVTVGNSSTKNGHLDVFGTTNLTGDVTATNAHFAGDVTIDGVLNATNFAIDTDNLVVNADNIRKATKDLYGVVKLVDSNAEYERDDNNQFADDDVVTYKFLESLGNELYDYVDDTVTTQTNIITQRLSLLLERVNYLESKPFYGVVNNARVASYVSNANLPAGEPTTVLLFAKDGWFLDNVVGTMMDVKVDCSTIIEGRVYAFDVFAANAPLIISADASRTIDNRSEVLQTISVNSNIKLPVGASVDLQYNDTYVTTDPIDAEYQIGTINKSERDDPNYCAGEIKVNSDKTLTGVTPGVNVFKLIAETGENGSIQRASNLFPVECFIPGTALEAVDSVITTSAREYVLIPWRFINEWYLGVIDDNGKVTMLHSLDDGYYLKYLSVTVGDDNTITNITKKAADPDTTGDVLYWPFALSNRYGSYTINGTEYPVMINEDLQKLYITDDQISGIIGSTVSDNIDYDTNTELYIEVGRAIKNAGYEPAISSNYVLINPDDETFSRYYLLVQSTNSETQETVVSYLMNKATGKLFAVSVTPGPVDGGTPVIGNVGEAPNVDIDTLTGYVKEFYQGGTNVIVTSVRKSAVENSSYKEDFEIKSKV